MIAERVARLADAMGLSATIEYSRLSESAYITVADPDSAEAWEWRIRVSSHAARPTYARLHGEADFELGEHEEGDGNWRAAVRWLARQANRKPVWHVRRPFSQRGARLADRVIMALRRRGLPGEELILGAWGHANYHKWRDEFLAGEEL
jgi:hypothetical protein